MASEYTGVLKIYLYPKVLDMSLYVAFVLLFPIAILSV